MRKNSSDREKLLKFKAEGREYAKFLRSLEQFIQTVKGQNYFCNLFFRILKWENFLGFRNMEEKLEREFFDHLKCNLKTS